MLTLLCGIAHSRLGRLDLGQQWAMVAQLRARMLGDRTLEVRALNVSGAVALERGGIDEASYFFTRAQEQAMQDNDMATVGRCANNLGIIATMQGDYPRAIGAYTRAIAAYERAHYHRGIAESRHNLGSPIGSRGNWTTRSRPPTRRCATPSGWTTGGSRPRRWRDGPRSGWSKMSRSSPSGKRRKRWRSTVG